MVTIFIAFLKKIIQLLNYVLAVALWLFGIGLMIWYPMRWWPGDKFIPVQMLNYFMPWLLLPLVPGLILAAWSKQRWLSLTLAIPTILITYNYAPLFLPRSTPPVLADSGQIKVMSHNIWHRNDNIQS